MTLVSGKGGSDKNESQVRILGTELPSSPHHYILSLAPELDPSDNTDHEMVVQVKSVTEGLDAQTTWDSELILRNTVIKHSYLCLANVRMKLIRYGVRNAYNFVRQDIHVPLI